MFIYIRPAISYLITYRERIETNRELDSCVASAKYLSSNAHDSPSPLLLCDRLTRRRKTFRIPPRMFSTVRTRIYHRSIHRFSRLFVKRNFASRKRFPFCTVTLLLLYGSRIAAFQPLWSNN